MTIDSVKVMLNGFDWAWPQAVRQIFENRNVELLMVKRPDEALNVLEHRRVHTAIVDMDSKTLSGLSMIKIIRSSFPTLPCILLAEEAEEKLLAAALELDVFSVMNKPVDINLLQSQLNRLFVKRYDNYLFNS